MKGFLGLAPRLDKQLEIEIFMKTIDIETILADLFRSPSNV